jgi:LuxR family transcriptional regulator of csgAB operon
MENSVYIIGPLEFQNELLASFLNTSLGCKCFIEENFESIDFENRNDKKIFLIDISNGSLAKFWELMKFHSLFNKPKVSAAFFNSPIDQKLYVEYRNAISHGLRGIFFENESIKLIVKGIKTIIKGELWISRNFINKLILEKRITDDDFSLPQVNLSPREKEIILRIAAGESNSEIAEQLNISYHTVKTHISNIFCKINVNNRFQAALWAAKNM